MQATALIVTRYGIIMRLVFFFSSRRRHTRFDCDWSSDVCSSDLLPMPVLPTWVTRHKSRDLHLVPTVTIDAITVTPLGRSLLDLGAVEPGRVGAAIDSARRHHDLAWAELLNVLIVHAKRGRDGVGPLRRVLAHHYGDPKFDSRTESRGLTILRDAGVPEPVMHHPVVAADGLQVELDMAWPEYRAGAEVDGLDHLTREE